MKTAKTTKKPKAKTENWFWCIVDAESDTKHGDKVKKVFIRKATDGVSALGSCSASLILTIPSARKLATSLQKVLENVKE